MSRAIRVRQRCLEGGQRVAGTMLLPRLQRVGMKMEQSSTSARAAAGGDSKANAAQRWTT
jgi:hypothetical protein